MPLATLVSGWDAGAAATIAAKRESADEEKSIAARKSLGIQVLCE